MYFGVVGREKKETPRKTIHWEVQEDWDTLLVFQKKEIIADSPETK